MALLLCASVVSLATAAVPLTYTGIPSPAMMWKDTAGNQIRAHQPNIVLLDGLYYWYGAAQVGNSSGQKGTINLYMSNDLYNWDFKGAAYTSSGGYAARPSMIGKNPVTGKYVMWMKGAKGSSFQVAEADSPDGTFHEVATLDAPFGADAGGSQAFGHPNGESAFIFYSNKEPREIRVASLTRDWRNIEQRVLATIGRHFEAPAPFYSAFTRKFYVLCSHLSGWWPNPAQLFVADHIHGPWRSLGNPTGDDRSYGTQVSHVLPVGLGADYVEKFVYMSDRWRPYINTPEGGRYVFLPMEIQGKPLQAVNPHSHVVSRGPVLRGQKDGSIVIRPVEEGEWNLERWPAAAAQNVASQGARGLPAVPIAAAVPQDVPVAPGTHGSADQGSHVAEPDTLAAPAIHGSANWGSP